MSCCRSVCNKTAWSFIILVPFHEHATRMLISVIGMAGCVLPASSSRILPSPRPTTPAPSFIYRSVDYACLYFSTSLDVPDFGVGVEEVGCVGQDSVVVPGACRQTSHASHISAAAFFAHSRAIDIRNSCEARVSTNRTKKRRPCPTRSSWKWQRRHRISADPD